MTNATAPLCLHLQYLVFSRVLDFIAYGGQISIFYFR